MNGPSWLGALRHGQSVGNVLAERAEAERADVIPIEWPDADVPLSDLGREQAEAVGLWFAGHAEPPSIVVASPYRRTVDTAEIVAAKLGRQPRYDERLRDRELGILDRLTSSGVASRLPDEAARRRFYGKFYYRPPAGESWADVALRLRSFLSDLRAEATTARVLLVTHEAVILLLRYLIEELSVPNLLELANRPLANGGLTTWEGDGQGLRLCSFDDAGPVAFRTEPGRPLRPGRR